MCLLHTFSGYADAFHFADATVTSPRFFQDLYSCFKEQCCSFFPGTNEIITVIQIDGQCRECAERFIFNHCGWPAVPCFRGRRGADLKNGVDILL